MKHNLHKMMAMFVASIFAVGAFAADVDVTSKVGTSKEAWNAGGVSGDWDNGIGGMPEKYETTTATTGDVMWQTVTGLENGKYTVELWANARYTSDRGFDSPAENGQHDCTYLFANNVEISIPVVHNAGCNSNTSHVLEGVVVTDGTLKMGMTKKAAGSNWHTIQIKSLIYNGVDLTALKDAFTAEWDEFAAYSEESLNDSWNAVNNNYFWPVYDEAEAFAAGLEEITEAAEIEAMMAKMSAAIASVEAAYAAGVEHAKFSALMENAMGFSTMADEAECMAACEVYQANSGMMFGYSAETKEAIEAATALIKNAYLQFIANAIPAEGTLFDVTFMIKNAQVNGSEGWTNAEGRINPAVYEGAPDDKALDVGWWTSNIDINQVLPTLPEGEYVLSAIARSNSPESYIYAKVGENTVKATLPQNGGENGVLGNGWEEVKTELFIVDGELTIGVFMHNPGTTFAAADNFALYYGGYLEDPEAAALAQKKEVFLARAEQFRTFMDNNVDWSLQMINQTYLYPVSDEVLGDEGYGIVGLVDKMDEVTDIETLEYWMAEMDKVEALLAEANAAAAEFAKWQGLIQHAAGFVATYDEATVEAAMMYIEFSVGYNCATVEAINEATVGAEEAYKNFVLGATPVEGEKFDVTFLIQNPNFEKNMDGWTCVKAQYNGGEGYNGVGGIAEIAEWGATSWDASMSQTLTELPNGKYVVKASWMAASGIEMTFAANEGTATVTGIGDQGGNIAKDGSVVEMGQGHRGWQYVEVECVVVDGTLAIVVSSSSSVQYQWSNADAFELYYAGKDGGLVDGIKSVKSETNAVIYDLQGRRVQKMEKGLYIVNGKKVLVK